MSNSQELLTQVRKERPVLFNSEMVNAILSGRKTVTRRIAKGVPLNSPAGKPGDVLWVRETWMYLAGTGINDADGKPHRYAYGADCLPGSASDEARKDFGLKWKPSIHMPREACRLRLGVTDVRLERLQDISIEEARAEGCPDASQKDPVGWYRSLWQSIHGQASWDAGPFVWVIHFMICQQPDGREDGRWGDSPAAVCASIAVNGLDGDGGAGS